jgi:hypothetical protein
MFTLPSFKAAAFHVVDRIAIPGIARPLSWVGFLTVLWMPPVAWGGPPQVEFDTAPLVACRDVTPPEFAAVNPDEKMIEARFRISALIRRGSESDLLQFFYRIDSPHVAMRVCDFLPKTTLASDLAGNVTIERKTERSNHVGVTTASPFDWPIKATGSGDFGTKSNDMIRYELVPPVEAVAASGTLRRGQAVYFKLRTSRSDSLEGDKEFVVVFHVPRGWRGDYVIFDCRALGVHRGVVTPLDEQVTAGSRRFVISLYAEGDAVARLAAERVVQAEAELLRQATARHDEIVKRSYPTVAHKLGALLDVVEPKVPKLWTEQFLFAHEDDDQLSAMAARLPSPVRDAALAYVAAKRDLADLRFE